MILPNGALVAVVDGEKLVLFRNSGHTDIKLSAVENPEMAERASGSPGHPSSGSNPDNDTQAEDGFAMGVAQTLNSWALTGKLTNLLVIAAPAPWASCASTGTRTFRPSWSARSPRT